MSRSRRTVPMRLFMSLIAGVLIAFGAWIVNERGEVPRASAPRTKLDLKSSLSADGSDHGSLAFALTAVVRARKPEAVPAAIAPQGLEGVEAQLDTVPVRSELFSMLGDDELGRRLRRLALARSGAGSVKGIELLNEDYLPKLREAGPVALERVVEAIERGIETGIEPNERAALLQVAGHLRGEPSRLRELALQQLEHARPSSPSEAPTPEGLRLADSAYALYLRNSPDAATAYEGMIQLLHVEPDAFRREKVIAQFVERFPELEHRLSEDLRSKGLHPQQFSGPLPYRIPAAQ